MLFSLITKALLACILVSALLTLAPEASSHGSYTTNLSDQEFTTAPETAEFLFDTEVDLSSAAGQLRFLGDTDVSADAYFKTDVPTTKLVLLEPAEGTDTQFSFKLPPLAKGLYALDWKVTPINDHETEAIQLFTVTEGVSTGNSAPVLTVGLLVGAFVVILGFIFQTIRKERNT